MGLLAIAEVFGHYLNDHSPASKQDRVQRRCPFRGGACTKGNAHDPIGICSFTDGLRLASVCPYRFVESQRIFKDVGRLAFGQGARIVAAPEIRILRVPEPAPKGGSREKRVGKVDYLIAALDRHGKAVDFAALETQAVYFSGGSLRAALRMYMQTGHMPEGSRRRPDWRSSAQKRLMPQLSLKVPVFRRWGKKFFVGVDSLFFEALPKMKRVESLANSEVTWLVYPFRKQGERFTIGEGRAEYTTWEDVLTALREGTPPDPSEILAEIERKRISAHLKTYVT